MFIITRKICLNVNHNNKREVVKYIMNYLIFYQEQHSCAYTGKDSDGGPRIQPSGMGMTPDPLGGAGGCDIKNTWICLQLHHCDPG